MDITGDDLYTSTMTQETKDLTIMRVKGKKKKGQSSIQIYEVR